MKESHGSDATMGVGVKGLNRSILVSSCDTFRLASVGEFLVSARSVCRVPFKPGGAKVALLEPEGRVV